LSCASSSAAVAVRIPGLSRSSSLVSAKAVRGDQRMPGRALGGGQGGQRCPGPAAGNLEKALG
jgi:hypothetical protein